MINPSARPQCRFVASTDKNVQATAGSKPERSPTWSDSDHGILIYSKGPPGPTQPVSAVEAQADVGPDGRMSRFDPKRTLLARFSIDWLSGAWPACYSPDA